MPFDAEQEIVLVLVATLALLTLLWAVRRRQGHVTRRSDPADAGDTLAAFPPQAVRVLTVPERRALDLLRKALPERLVLAQVPLARFISVPTRHSQSYSDWLTRIGRLSVDLLVCDSSSRVVAAVDIRTGGESARSQHRHQRMAEVLQRAGIAVHTWNADSLPSPAEIRRAFLTKAEAEQEQFDAAGKRMLPLPEITEVVTGLDDGSALQPQFDPVSSNYFDDLEALPGAR